MQAIDNIDSGTSSYFSPYQESYQGYSYSSPSYSTSTVATSSGSIQQFDVSPSAIAYAQSLGNVPSDIQSAYQTYLTGVPTGRGGEYAVSAKKKYGYATIQDAAAAYLQAAGLNFLSPVEETTTQPITSTEQQRNPFEILADVLPKILGQAQQLPALKSQQIEYTPVQTSAPSPVSSTRSYSSLLIIGVIAVIGYFLYKRYA